MTEKTELTKAYYDERFGTLSQQLNEEETIRWHAIESALKQHAKTTPLNIADFGCGRGWLSNKLSHFGNVTGFDISEKAIANAQHSYPGINFICLDASTSIPPELTGKFDLVVSSEVIEHLHDQASYLKNIYSLLRTGGEVLITTPNGKWHDAFYQGERISWKQPVENWITLPGLIRLLNHTGFVPLFSDTFNSEWVFAYRPQIKTSRLAHPILRKALKATGLYNFVLKQWNTKQYGLNSIVYASKRHGSNT